MWVWAVPAERFYSWACLFSPCHQEKQTVTPMGRRLRSWKRRQLLTGWRECRCVCLHPSTCTAESEGCNSTAKRGRAHNTRPKCEQEDTLEKVLAYHSDYRTYTALYLGGRIIVEACEWVVIVARAFIILVCGHVWHGYSQKTQDICLKVRDQKIHRHTHTILIVDRVTEYAKTYDIAGVRVQCLG